MTMASVPPLTLHDKQQAIEHLERAHNLSGEEWQMLRSAMGIGMHFTKHAHLLIDTPSTGLRFHCRCCDKSSGVLTCGLGNESVEDLYHQSLYLLLFTDCHNVRSFITSVKASRLAGDGLSEIFHGKTSYGNAQVIAELVSEFFSRTYLSSVAPSFFREIVLNIKLPVGIPLHRASWDLFCVYRSHIWDVSRCALYNGVIFMVRSKMDARAIISSHPIGTALIYCQPGLYPRCGILIRRSNYVDEHSLTRYAFESLLAYRGERIEHIQQLCYMEIESIATADINARRILQNYNVKSLMHICFDCLWRHEGFIGEHFARLPSDILERYCNFLRLRDIHPRGISKPLLDFYKNHAKAMPAAEKKKEVGRKLKSDGKLKSFLQSRKRV